MSLLLFRRISVDDAWQQFQLLLIVDTIDSFIIFSRHFWIENSTRSSTRKRIQASVICITFGRSHKIGGRQFQLFFLQEEKGTSSSSFKSHKKSSLFLWVFLDNSFQNTYPPRLNFDENIKTLLHHTQ